MIDERVVAWEVWQHMVALRERNEIKSDSARLCAAIRQVAQMRNVRFQVVEAALDGALAFRRA
jgi:hypothetical protein